MIAISRTGRLLRRLVRVACRRPLVTVILALVLAAAGLVVTVQHMGFKTSGRDVLPQDAGYVKKYVEFARDFGELEDIVVVVEAPTLEAAKAYASRLVQELRASPVKFPRLSYRIDPKRFQGRQLLYLSTEKLREIRDKIFDHQEFMEGFANDPSLARLLEGVNLQFAQSFMNNVFDLGIAFYELQVPLVRFSRILTASDDVREIAERNPSFGIIRQLLRRVVLTDERSQNGAFAAKTRGEREEVIWRQGGRRGHASF